ncbi:MAG TPA: alpha/beta fold hydrolase [Puia sp.]|nr:alpha/beta fold hydrolase [Puia sp.]
MKIKIFSFIFYCLIILPLLPKANPPFNDTSGYFSSFDGTRIYYEVKGSGEPVVLVHGFIVDGESWKKTVLYDDLLKRGNKVITLDLRGNGKSDKPHDSTAYANDAEAKDIMGLVQMLGLQHYGVVGYSRGSIIIARLLVLDKRITKAVMGGIGVDFTNPNWPRRIMFYKALSGEPVKELEPMVKRVQESGLDQKALACMQQEQPSTSKEELAGIKQPVLIICGDIDQDNGSSQELVKLIPHAIHTTVPGDHGSASRSKEFSEKIISFLSKDF